MAFVEAWNKSKHRSRLAGFGPCCFAVEGEPSRQLCLDWDEDGVVSRVEDRRWPTFSASLDEWSSFIAGEFPAALGLLSGRLRYNGRIGAIVRYSLAFNDLPAVARTISRLG